VVDTTRDMLYIEDLVRLVKTCVEQQITGTYDVCSGVQTPIMDLFRLVADEMGYRKVPPLIPPDPDDVQGRISLMKALPSWRWEPMVPLEEGIRRTVQSYREDGITETHTHLKIGSKDAS
jgi:UDP-glucose 4-epimerase